MRIISISLFIVILEFFFI